jgi:Transcription factor WhiB
MPLAHAAADYLDWHRVAELVRCGCPPRLRLRSPAEAVPMTGSRPVRPLAGDALWARVPRYARCADSGLDPDEWFPVSIEAAQARHEAAAAIAVCTSCPVRAECLMLSLRHWDIGQHGIWDGLIAADRAWLRRRVPAGRGGRRRTAVSELIVRSSSPWRDGAWGRAGTLSEH